MPAAHGLLGVFCIDKYICTAHTHTNQERDGKHHRSNTKVFPYFFFPRLGKFGKEENTYHHADIVRHLRVQEKANIGKEHHQQCPPAVLLAIGQQEPYHHKHHPSDGIAFPVVRSSDNHEEIRRKRNGECPRHAEPFIYFERAKQEKECQQVEHKYHGGVSIAPREKFANRLQ